MLKHRKKELSELLEAAILRLFDHRHEPVIEQPPRRELGDLAAPIGLHLARVLKRNPREIAQELAAAIDPPDWIRDLRVEGAGYLNFFIDRPPFAAEALIAPLIEASASDQKIIVEHTNINPNKAAHIGHLRNAVLGDVLVRCTRALGYETEVQNYIDDTGVQVADVVVGFVDLRRMSLAEVAAAGEPFDYLCWDLYSEVGRYFEADESRLELRRKTLHELESGEGERAEMGRLVARRIVQRHLLTMARLGIGYDVLTRESEILRLHFFDVAFEHLKETGAVHLEEAGKNEGCWVMPLSESEEFKGLEDPDKVIVRSDGTITYVGKDIAYQMWKFGELGRDFEYTLWPESQNGDLWETSAGGEGVAHPSFGNGDRVINVIDARQSYLQKIVRAGLEAVGLEQQAEQSVHFAYEMVSLSEATARQLGFLGDEEDKTGKSLEMSGRKGIGVKADDLLDQLVEKSKAEIAERNRELDDEALDLLARQIATAALRYFMVKSTTTRVIAFDLDSALSFEGDSGPYLQYSAVRAQNILRRLDEEGIESSVGAEQVGSADAELWSDDLWDLVLSVAQTDEIAERAAATLELSLLARHAGDLAQKFHAVYHRHPILHEENEQLRTVRLAAVHVFRRGLEQVLDLLGIPMPERM